MRYTAGMGRYLMVDTFLWLVLLALLLLVCLVVAERTVIPAFAPRGQKWARLAAGLLVIAVLLGTAAQRGLLRLPFAPPVAAEVDWADDPAGPGGDYPPVGGGSDSGPGEDYPYEG